MKELMEEQDTGMDIYNSEDEMDWSNFFFNLQVTGRRIDRINW